MTVSADVPVADCPNCGAALDSAFCAECGQRAGPLNPSLRDVLHELVHETLNIDGKLLQSLRLLLARPGFLTREHFEGRRARYVPPIRLYLIASVLFFVATASAPNLQPNLGVRVTFTADADDSPADLAAAERRRPELQGAVNETLTQWTPRVMFALVPLFGGLTGLVTRRSGRNYPQHLYFALHVHAAWFIGGAVAAAARIVTIPYVTNAAPGIFIVCAAVYMALAFGRTYNTTIAGAVWRSAVVGVTYALVTAGALVAITLPLIWNT